MKNTFSIILRLFVGLITTQSALLARELTTNAFDGEYTLVVSGYDWGPAANKVILNMGESVTTVDAGNYSVSATRSSELAPVPPERSEGNRDIVFAYISNENGDRTETGQYITLVLSVSPDNAIASPMEYYENRNHWIDYNLSITQTSTDRIWKTESNRIRPIVDDFDLSGVYQHEDGIILTYAAFHPTTERKKSPLIIWLHGGGEGGTDPSIALMANLAANYASDEIQAIFEGAYVLAPQTPTFWMENAEGEYTLGQVNDIQNEALMGLIKHFVDSHPGVDADRIYVGGCSNGGYMSLKLILLNPDFFAAGYISALGYQSQYLSDEQIESIKHVPIWFMHSVDDHTLRAEETATPVYKRLIEAGATNVHYSLYDHVIDIRGFFGGENYWYNGHFSWIYSHANTARLDYDGFPVKVEGRPVTVMEWVAAQKNE